jgi:hypothetical protein
MVNKYLTKNKKGKLKDAKLDGNLWLIPSVQNKPKRNEEPCDYLLDGELIIDEYPFVKYSECIMFFKNNDKIGYDCLFSHNKNDFREELFLSKDEVERLEYLLISSGKAKQKRYMQWTQGLNN